VNFTISGYSVDDNLSFVNLQWSLNNYNSRLENNRSYIPGFYIQQAKNPNKVSGNISAEIYAVNNINKLRLSTRISNTCDIVINYNFCDYNVTLNDLPSLKNSSNPVIEISGYVGVEYDNLAELTGGIVRNYGTNDKTNVIIPTSTLSSELTFNKHELNLSIDDNKLKRLFL
jgi:hypothetical protein